MDFSKLSSKKMLIPFLVVILLIGTILWKTFSKADSSIPESDVAISPIREELSQEDILKSNAKNFSTKETHASELEFGNSEQEDYAIEQQLNRDREEQKQTKYLKNKLEQTNLQLEQEKAMAEINKLKMENTGALNDSMVDGQRTIPEVRVDYIGGDSIKKEAILSIAGASFQVKEKSNPIDSIQVVSISDSSVTLHFSAPVELTKTIDYKPE